MLLKGNLIRLKQIELPYTTIKFLNELLNIVWEIDPY